MIDKTYEADAMTGSFSSQEVYYNNISLTHGKAGDCIGANSAKEPVLSI